MRVTSRPLALVSSRVTRAPVTSRTFGRSSAGSTQITWASDLARTRHGWPSHVPQRMQAEAEERGAVELGIAADPVVRVGMERLAVAVAPRLLRLILPLEVDRPRAPVVRLARHVLAALEEQDLLPRRGQRPRERAAAGAGADDRDVVTLHRPSLPERTRGKASCRRPRRWSGRERSRRRRTRATPPSGRCRRGRRCARTG